MRRLTARGRWHRGVSVAPSSPVKPNVAVLALVLASPLASGCVEPGVCDGAGLLLVQTADEEADEMHRFRDECRPLSLRALDDAATADGPLAIEMAWSGTPGRSSVEGLAFVVVRSGHQATAELAQSLVAFGKSRLAHYKVPQRIEFVTALPRSDRGKVLRRVLRKSPAGGTGPAS